MTTIDDLLEQLIQTRDTITQYIQNDIPWNDQTLLHLKNERARIREQIVSLFDEMQTAIDELRGEPVDNYRCPLCHKHECSH